MPRGSLDMPPLALSVALLLALGACVGARGGDEAEARAAAARGTDSEMSRTDDGAREQEAMNALTPEEAAEGFRLLFDGTSLEAWRGFRRDDVPAGWSAEDGLLAFTPGVDGGDLITRETFADFDLRLEFRVSEGGNSGIFFGITEEAERTYHAGPELQILDDERHPDGASDLTSTGSNYGLHAPSRDVARPAGAWNEARIVRRGDRVEHWLNGVRVVDYELGSDAWRELVAGSKFAEWPEYGTVREGHIGLQDHGDRVWFRNLRIRPL